MSSETGKRLCYVGPFSKPPALLGVVLRDSMELGQVISNQADRRLSLDAGTPPRPYSMGCGHGSVMSWAKRLIVLTPQPTSLQVRGASCGSIW